MDINWRKESGLYRTLQPKNYATCANKIFSINYYRKKSLNQSRRVCAKFCIIEYILVIYNILFAYLHTHLIQLKDKITLY